MNNDIQPAKQILFDAEMTKAIIDGHKTQTRRAVKTRSTQTFLEKVKNSDDWYAELKKNREYITVHKPQYKKGDILWVREPARVVRHTGEEYPSTEIEYLSDGAKVWFHNFSENEWEKDWLVNCKGVPNGCTKKMARIFIKVTDVRVERLQEISHPEIEKEGSPHRSSNEELVLSAEKREENFNWWIKLWDKNAQKAYKWNDNPWVRVYEFEVIEKRVVNA